MTTTPLGGCQFTPHLRSISYLLYSPRKVSIVDLSACCPTNPSRIIASAFSAVAAARRSLSRCRTRPTEASTRSLTMSSTSRPTYPSSVYLVASTLMKGALTSLAKRLAISVLPLFETKDRNVSLLLALPPLNSYLASTPITLYSAAHHLAPCSPSSRTDHQDILGNDLITDLVRKLLPPPSVTECNRHRPLGLWLTLCKIPHHAHIVGQH